MRLRSPSARYSLFAVALTLVVRFDHVYAGSSDVIPTAWDEAELKSQFVPLADPRVSLEPIDAKHYYALPVRRLWRSYPVYHPDREPAGYPTWLAARHPEELKFDDARDWVEYGRAVFELPTGLTDDAFSAIVTPEQLKDREWFERVGVRWDKATGIVPYARYVVRTKGKVEIGVLACAMCHTRVLDDGTVVVGAQGNYPFDRNIGLIEHDALAAGGNEQELLTTFRAFDSMLFGAPWVRGDPLEPIAPVTFRKYMEASDAIPPGVLARHGTSPILPVPVPDLIGIRERRYLDRTGLMRHRGIADLMRYAALNVSADLLTAYRIADAHDVFVPIGDTVSAQLTERYSDEQLYALAQYLYSLKAPDNPFLPRSSGDAARVAHGKAVFERLHCGLCHRPPAYTNNRLTPVDGFTVPATHLVEYEVTELSLGTDPRLSLETRRGTGYYKVPSLRGVWYRGPFEHNGSIATLEDWFDARRLRDDYVPTGWKGPPGTEHRAVRGHPYGLNLPADDRTALIAFLRTL